MRIRLCPGGCWSGFLDLDFWIVDASITHKRVFVCVVRSVSLIV